MKLRVVTKIKKQTNKRDRTANSSGANTEKRKTTIFFFIQMVIKTGKAQGGSVTQR